VVTAKTALMRAQRRWADVHGVRYDARGFVRVLGENLREPLDDAAIAEFQRGSELMPRATQPARAHSLCSSAALVVNVFGYWRGRDQTPLLEALGVGGPGGTRLELEAPLPTGLPGDPPTVDVALYRPDGRCVAVESKFAEWLAPRPRGKRVFKDKYFAQGRVWEAAGLPLCQTLAEDLQEGRERLKHLHAAQLLKHALGLAVNGLRTSTLVYLYYDGHGREAATHRAEIDRVVSRLKPELELRAATYQALFGALRPQPGIDRAYLDYLAQRYFA
jgi:restriction endonuclease-like protein